MNKNHKLSSLFSLVAQMRFRAKILCTKLLRVYFQDGALGNLVNDEILDALRIKRAIHPRRVYFGHVAGMDTLFCRIARTPGAMTIRELSKKWNGPMIRLGPEIGSNDTDILYKTSTDSTVSGAFLRAREQRNTENLQDQMVRNGNHSESTQTNVAGTRA